MPKQRNVYILPGFGENMIARMFTNRGWNVVDSIDDCDLVQFIGGEDVTPSLYGQHTHISTHCNPDRDAKEQGVFELAIAMGLPMAGICRGGQFLNVMNGGNMFQDVNHHGGLTGHKAKIIGKLVDLTVSSTHHQMMRANLDREANCHVLMVADLSTEKTYMSSILNEGGKFAIKERPNILWREDIEALYYANTNCLCYQPHPEFVGAQYKQCTDCYFNFIDTYLFNDDGSDVDTQAAAVIEGVAA